MINGIPEGETIYLAIRYSGTEEEKQQRFDTANFIAAKLMEMGYAVYSPISHTHPISKHIDEGFDNHEFWMEQDRTWFERCENLVVVDEYEVEKSIGVSRELGWADVDGINVSYVNISDFVVA